MKNSRFTLFAVPFAITFLSVIPASKAWTGEGQTASRDAKPGTSDVRGTWSGTFLSKHPNVQPFTATIVIGTDDSGALVATSNLVSDCIENPTLQVKVVGSKVELAGSDAQGDNIIVRGTLDKTATLLTANFVINGSASGKCETDTGSGTLGKR